MRTGAHLSNYTSKWFSGGWFISTVHWEQIMKPSQCTMKPYYTSNEFHQKKSRAGEQEKKRSNHPSVESLSLPCVEVQLNTEQSREASSIPGKIFITATNFQVSRTGEQDSLRESSHFWFHALSRISLHGMETHSPPPPPNPFFHCSGGFLPSMAARKHAVSGH